MKLNLPKRLDVRGASLVDYGIIVGLVATVSVAAIVASGGEVKEAYCSASNGMNNVTKNDKNPSCYTNPEEGIELANGNRFVDAEEEPQANFTDVEFSQETSDDRTVMVERSQDTAQLGFSNGMFQVASLEATPMSSDGSFILNTSLASRDEYDPNRDIASCYSLGTDIRTICSESGPNASISVPKEAVAYGYLVSVIEDTDMPWENTVAINIPSGGAVAPGNWNVTVKRAEAAPVVENVNFAFGPQTFGGGDAGWTYGPFANIEGKFNRPISFQAISQAGDTRNRQVCYKATPDAAAECSNSTSSDTGVSIQVPAGAAQIGYRVELPQQTIGDDWVATERFSLISETVAVASEDVVMTRPNEPRNNGGVASAFAETYNYLESDTGLTEGEFINLTGERNVPINLYMVRHSDSNTDYYRSACYKTTIGGDGICSPSTRSNTSISWSVPEAAVQVGYEITLPATKVGGAWQTKETIQLDHGRLINQAAVIVRPNEQAQGGGVETAFTSPYQFQQTDTGWTDGEFIKLTGERNVNLTMTMSRQNTADYYRKACYKDTSGALSCGTSTRSNSIARHTIPLEAVEIGYQFQLPAEAVSANPYTYKESIQVQGASAVQVNQMVVIERPNEAQNNGGTVTFANNSHDFAATDEGWVENLFALSPERNVSLTLVVRYDSVSPYRRRQGCHRMVAGGELTCGDIEYTGYSDNVYHTIPVGAVEAGYRYQLPAAGTNFSAKELIQITGGGAPTPYNAWVFVTRPAS